MVQEFHEIRLEEKSAAKAGRAEKKQSMKQSIPKGPGKDTVHARSRKNWQKKGPMRTALRVAKAEARKTPEVIREDEILEDAALDDSLLRSIAFTGARPSHDEASVSSRATSTYTANPTGHGALRMEQRAVQLRDLQAAKKHGTKLPALYGRWKFVHNGVVYITDKTQKKVITTWRTEPPAAATRP